jgi:hypothetical protein
VINQCVDMRPCAWECPASLCPCVMLPCAAVCACDFMLCCTAVNCAVLQAPTMTMTSHPT